MNYLTSKELAEILKVSIKTISRWRKKGLPTTQVGRIHRYELHLVKEWLDKQK